MTWHFSVVLKFAVSLLEELQCLYVLICGNQLCIYCGVCAKHFANLESARSGGGFNELKSFSFIVKFYEHKRLLRHQTL